jgi:hypothetical protein
MGPEPFYGVGMDNLPPTIGIQGVVTYIMGISYGG